MKVLAVIPARAGSKGIPNKNIRIIGEHPLIYYSIKNALASSYVTDVIISTDSDSVRIIGNQMGVRVKLRDASLCGDAVTLDAVIYDAIPWSEGWDYVVTMQPTSPTLKVDTLDAAIKFAIDNDLDTLISCVNSPRLSWGEKNGKKVPNYSERLNRQYLPPCYIETGAFVVSKASVITAKTRIGEKVNVFEIPEGESYDVDSFEDLKNVASIIERKKVAIYVNGNEKIGTDSIYRALELADEFYSKPDIYYDINQTNAKAFGSTTYNLIPVDGIQDLYNRCQNEQYTLFISDTFNTSLGYMTGLRNVLPNAKLINFEDNGEGTLKADLVFNVFFNEKNLPQVKTGEKYYISGKALMFCNPVKIRDNVDKVFISFGDGDVQNYTDRLLDVICKNDYKRYQFIFVLGRNKYNADALLEYNRFENIRVLYDVSSITEIMNSCDIGITSCGKAAYELAALGIPSISMAQNYDEERNGFVNNENGFGYIGLNPENGLIKSTLDMYLKMSKEERQYYQNLLLSHDLRGGRNRIMELINGL